MGGFGASLQHRGFGCGLAALWEDVLADLRSGGAVDKSLCRLSDFPIHRISFAIDLIERRQGDVNCLAGGLEVERLVAGLDPFVERLVVSGEFGDGNGRGFLETGSTRAMFELWR